MKKKDITYQLNENIKDELTKQIIIYLKKKSLDFLYLKY